MENGSPRRRTGSRASILDRARGLAVVAMIAYHFSWDLSHFGLIEADVAFDPGWRLFAQCIAGSFLFISGVSLALSLRAGIGWAAVGKRLLLVGGAAVLVSIGSWLMFPDRFIFFGILHCMAVTGLLALPFRAAPLPVLGLAAAAALALPHAFKSAWFDSPALIWLGLAERIPATNDFVPLFPWIGFVLAGLLSGRIAVARNAFRFGDGQNVLERLGRWSLPIYLVHQPLLFACFMGLAQAGLFADLRQTKDFLESCALECETSGAGPGLCRRVCQCTANELKPLPIWRQLASGELEQAGQRLLDETGRKCLEASLKSSEFNAKP